MDQRPWRLGLYRRCRRWPGGRLRVIGRKYKSRWRVSHQLSSVWITLLAAVVVAAVGIGLLEGMLRPTLEITAKAQTKNWAVECLERTVSADLAERGVSYTDFVSIQRDEQGTITSVSTDMAKLNLLRSDLVLAVLDQLKKNDISEIAIPLGSLIDSELLWAKGPSIRIHSIQIGTVEAEFVSEFTEAGVNQTLHRIWLEWNIPLVVLLPGGSIDVPVSTKLSIAETIIVGKVPTAVMPWG